MTDASVHDSVPLLELVPKKPLKKNQPVYADSACAGEDIDKALRKRKYKPISVSHVGCRPPLLCEKGYRNQPLTEEQKERNREKSKVRCRIEHIFGAMKSRCRDEVLRTIGMARATFWIGMRNLTYNMSRLTVLKSPRPK